MKKLFLIIGIPVLAAVITIAALLLFVDPNQFKPLIVEQTKKQIGLDLVIDGDIGWRVFPSVGLSLGKTEIKNPQGFKNANLLKIDEIDVDVSLMPLLQHQLMIGNVILDGAEIYLETQKDGRSNLDSLSKKQDKVQDKPVEQPQEAAKETSTPAAKQQWEINLAGVSVTNALLEIQDDAKGSYVKLYDVGLSVSEFIFDQWTTVSFEAKGRNNQQNFTAVGTSEFILSKDLSRYELRNIALDSTFSDPTTDISTAKIALDTFAFDKVNKLDLAVKGSVADLDIDMSLTSDLKVDQAITQVLLDNILLKSELKGASLPQSPMVIAGESSFSFDLNKQFIAFTLKKLAINAIQLDGKSTVQLNTIPKIRFDVHSPNIDLDAFLGLNTNGKTASKKQEDNSDIKTGDSQSSLSTVAEVEPDLSALKNLDIQGTVRIDKFKANNVNMQRVTTDFAVNRGVVDLNSFSSKLYQGSIKASAQLDARKSPASYWVKKQIQNVKVQPLLKDAADNDMLEGTGNIDVNVTGKSLTPTGIKKNLLGTIKINFTDGAVNGINIAQIIRVNYAKIKGQKVESTESKKTDFSAMGATMNFSKGVMTTNDLSMSSPLLRIHGQGQVNYINETMDMNLDTSVVGSLEGQGGKSISELTDVTIPVRLFGEWTKPQYEIEFDKLWKKLEQQKKKQLEKKAEKELNKLLGDKIKDDDTKQLADKLLKGLFN